MDIGPTVKETTVSQMEAAIVALSRELTKLRTGRASPGILPWIIFILIFFVVEVWWSDNLTYIFLQCFFYRNA